MNLHKLSYSQDGVSAEITVRRASALDAIRRGLMIEEAAKTQDDDPVLHMARVNIIPMLASVSEVEIIVDGVPFAWPPVSPAELDLIPEDLIDQWMGKVYEANPGLLRGTDPKKA